MTIDQGLAFAIIAAMMALFLWGRPRYDLTACLALLVAVGVGIVNQPSSVASSTAVSMIGVGSVGHPFCDCHD